MIVLKLHFKRNKIKKLEARHAQLLAGHHMAELMRKKRVSDLVNTQHANQHYHELNVQYKKQYQYIRAQLYRVTMMVERLQQAEQWVSASEHHHIHTIRQHWVDALCNIRCMIHQCQEYMSLFDLQINDHVAHLTGLDHALTTFVMELCQFNHATGPLIKNNGNDRARLLTSHEPYDHALAKNSFYPQILQQNQYTCYSSAQIHPT